MIFIAYTQHYINTCTGKQHLGYLSNLHELIPWDDTLVSLGWVNWLRGVLDDHFQMGETVTHLCVCVCVCV